MEGGPVPGHLLSNHHYIAAPLLTAQYAFVFGAGELTALKIPFPAAHALIRLQPKGLLYAERNLDDCKRAHGGSAPWATRLFIL